jgi:hypothetical protein
MADEVEQVYVEHIPALSSDPGSCRLALIQMTFAGGGIAVVDMNVDAGYGYEVAIHVTGESGSMGADGLSSAVVRHKQSAAQTVDPDWLVRFDQ